jgi:hypothetical protein
MKVNTIRIIGKHITENDDELEEGYVEIEAETYDILREINSEDVANYARWSLDMKHEDDFESDLDDFDNTDLWNHLNNSYSFDVYDELDDEDMVDYLERKGYTIDTPDFIDNGLDYVDASMLEEIENLFLNSSCAERVEIFNKIINA